jgi:hypothetical protein
MGSFWKNTSICDVVKSDRGLVRLSVLPGCGWVEKNGFVLKKYPHL